LRVDRDGRRPVENVLSAVFIYQRGGLAFSAQEGKGGMRTWEWQLVDEVGAGTGGPLYPSLASLCLFLGLFVSWKRGMFWRSDRNKMFVRLARPFGKILAPVMIWHDDLMAR